MVSVENKLTSEHFRSFFAFALSAKLMTHSTFSRGSCFKFICKPYILGNKIFIINQIKIKKDFSYHIRALALIIEQKTRPHISADYNKHEHAIG